MNVKLLENEEALSRQYLLNCDKDGLTFLTIDNVARVEAILQMDAPYKRYADVSIGERGKNLGSSAYWITELKNGRDLSECISKIVDVLDAENTTHINADGEGRKVIKQRILEECDTRDKLQNALLDENYKLIFTIAEKTRDVKGARCNFSFATKFCHYMCFYLFEDEEKMDRYSIFDGVVGGILPRYMQKYHVPDWDLLDKKGRFKEYKSVENIEQRKKYYSAYIGIIDDIRMAAAKETGQMISRNGLDHLLWFYYR